MRNPSVQSSLWLVVLCSILLAVGGDRADGAEEHAREAGETVIPLDEAPVPTSPEELRYTRSLVEEIRVARERQISEVEDLKQEFLQTKDPVRAIALQKQIQELKLVGQLELLEIQIRHAKRSGREEMAREAEASLESVRELLAVQAKKGGR